LIVFWEQPFHLNDPPKTARSSDRSKNFVDRRSACRVNLSFSDEH
jgi:hypothetical protein